MLIAGIDIGGTQLRAGIYDEDHRLVDSFKAVNDRSMKAPDNMAVLTDYLERYRGRLGGIGIGCPGPLDLCGGRLLNPPNLVGWDGFEIVRFVGEKTGLHPMLNNDANVAGLAEAHLGAGKGYESMAFMGISTGIGGAFIQKGRIFNGAHGNAAEFWNMIVNEDPRSHKNASPGSLNEQCSGSGLATAATALYGTPTDARTLFSRAKMGDSDARQVIEKAADALARGIANITCTFDPAAVVIGGSVAIHNPDYIGRAAELARKYIIYSDELVVKPAEFGDDAGMLGAALLAESNL